MASMEHPIFSLSTKPDHRVRRYENGGSYVEIKPSSDGLATVHDRDVLIYCISQLIGAMNDNREISQIVRFKAHDLLKSTNRMTNGQGYDALKAAFERLSGTRISTNIVSGGLEEFETFGLIERAKVVRQTREGRMQEVEVKLSDWVFSAIKQKEVLTLHRNYFRLRKPLERRIYEIARKHCGRQAEWHISLPKLQLKCGSTSTEKEFRRLLRAIVARDKQYGHMPDYSVDLSDDDMIVFQSRHGNLGNPQLFELPMQIRPETHLAAREAAPGWDVYLIEQEWREWASNGPSDALRNPDQAFIGFCRRWYERKGPAC